MNRLIETHKIEFEKYFNYLVEENKKYNLTAITTEEEAYIKHFEDSLALGNEFELNGMTLLDIGSGAGFPAIPLKICYPELKVTIIEPTQKRVNFMKNVISMLNLKGIEVICGRAEDIIKTNNMVEKFDFVVARAVANLSVLLELLVPYAKVNGKIVAYKGDKGKEEAEIAVTATKILSCKVEKIVEYSLRNDMGNRSLVIINKNKSTNNKYPRKYAEIKRKPL